MSRFEVRYIIAKLLQFIQIPQIHNCCIDRKAKIRFRCLVVGSNVNKYSYIAENSTVLYCDIGAYTSIASDCFIGGASHPIDWVSTSPVFQSCSSVLKEKIMDIKYDPYLRTSIGNDVWIGTHSLIKAGVTIGSGAVIGMGSVVTKDVPPYEIWAGNPAKKIADRFDEKVAKNLLCSKWWEMDIDELRRHRSTFTSPDKFVEEL